MANKGKIGVLIEDHFDGGEFQSFNEYFPSKGYEVEYLSHLWGQPSLRFGSNAEDNKIKHFVDVSIEVNDVDLSDYKAIILIGAYAMDRLRYEEAVHKGEKNKAPAVNFIRRAIQTPSLKVAAVCHGLWLLCAAPELLKEYKVTCAHNIISDVENAGATIVYGKDRVADVVVDKNLITGRHPEILDQFMQTLIEEIEND